MNEKAASTSDRLAEHGQKKKKKKKSAVDLSFGKSVELVKRGKS